MHIHILGICGTFMGGLAILARAAGHKVTGCDHQVYPPMSTQLQEQGIELIEGFGADQLNLKPDLFIIGNVVTRGNPLMEAILNHQAPYCSGPQWLGDHLLHKKHVLAVAGTHGKTTTATMLAWILEQAKLAPSFLIGGIPLNFGVSARLNTESPYFIIEADEYDTAFFDKRSKFVHYHARSAILNNLEYDHADIFPDISAIQTQFHHFVRTIPSQGHIIYPCNDPHLTEVLRKGCWSNTISIGANGAWRSEEQHDGKIIILKDGDACATLEWDLMGQHNQSNALACIALAERLGISPKTSVEALKTFKNVKRRMELRGEIKGIRVFDDFAHHPTAIQTTLSGIRKKYPSNRLIAVLEPRSNTMKRGAMREAIPTALAEAHSVYLYSDPTGKHALEWDLNQALGTLPVPGYAFHDITELVSHLSKEALPGDDIVIMSNGGFGNIHQKLLDSLKIKYQQVS